ncbi:hypothetical protein KKB83_05820 [Patescibacteria group bacterium]|nr:hypothetical protein [Patescibacteria group bacterium]
MEGSTIEKSEKPQSSVQHWSVEESRRRIQGLVEVQESEIGEEDGEKQGLEFSAETPREENEENHMIAKVPVAAIPSAATVADITQQTDDDSPFVDEAEEEKARKAGIKKAVFWLWAWWKRQRKKLALKV